MGATIQLRRDIASAWTTVNPVLADGEIGIEKDTRCFKIGDGTTPWVTLQYAVPTGINVGNGYGVWKWSSDLSGAPAHGRIAANSDVAASITELRISDLGDDDTDYSTVIEAAQSGDVIYVQNKDDASQWLRFVLTAAGVDNTSYWVLAVEFVASGDGVPANNHEVAVQITHTNYIYWDDILEKPTTFPPSAHTHTIAEVTGLQDALDAKEDSGAAAAAVAAHEAAADPHPQYTTAAELSAAVTAHEAAADPHPQYTTAAEASAAAPVQSVAGKTGVVTLVRADVGLANVNNTSDANKPISTATQTALDLKQNLSEKGVANGYAGLDSGGKVPAAQLPSYVDDVLEYANLAAFPATGESGKIYIALDTGKTWRWSGSAYSEISASPGSTDAVTEGSTNLYFTAQRVRDTVLTGLSTATNAVIAATDSVLSAFGKLQAQISALVLVAAEKVSKAGDSMTGPLNIDANSANAALRVTQLGAGDALLIEDSANPDSSPTVIDASGNLIKGARTSATLGLTGQGVQFHTAAAIAGAGVLIGGWSNSQTPSLTLARSTSGTVGTPGIVTSASRFPIRFAFDDGVNFVLGAQISGEVDGTPGVNDMPGRLVFSVTPPGSTTPVEVLRLDSARRMTLNGANLGYQYFGIRGTAPAASAVSEGFSARYIIPAGATTSATVFLSRPITEAAAFNINQLIHFGADPGAFGVGSSANSQYGFFATSNLTGATNNYGFYGNIPNVAGCWNFYGGGAAPSYLAGNLGLGITTPAQKLDVASSNNGLTGDIANNTIRFTDTDGSTTLDQPMGKIEWYSADSSNPGVYAYILAKARQTNGGADLRFGVTEAGGTVSEKARLTVEGFFTETQPTPNAQNAAATLTAAQLRGRIVTSGPTAAATLTLPLGTAMETVIFGAVVNDMSFDWSIINTGNFPVTLAANTGHTIVGSPSVLAGASGTFRSRKTAADTWVTYAISSSAGATGYAPGAGGSVTQATNKTTAVTINKLTGRITTASSSIAAGSTAAFTVNNSLVGPSDVVIINTDSVVTETYTAVAERVSSGSFLICLRNHTGSARSDVITLNFVVIKGDAA